MIPANDEQTVMTEATAAPEGYIRINITKNSKGYSHETTVSLRWTSGDYKTAIAAMLRESDILARNEIEERQRVDGSW